MGVSRTVALRGSLLAGTCGLVLSLGAGVHDAIMALDQTRSSLRQLAEASRMSVGVALYNIDQELITKHAEGLLAYPGVARVVIRDEQLANVAVDLRRPPPATRLILPIPEEAIDVALNETASSGRGRLVLYRDPYFVQERAFDHFHNSMVVALAESLIVLGALLFLMRRLVVVPLEQLTAFAKQVEQGERDIAPQSDVTRKDEIGTLTHALSDMAGRLLRDAQTLEQRVEERSRELDESRGRLMAQEKMAALGSLVAGVAHEVNTPLGASVTLSSGLHERFAALCEKVGAGTMTRGDLRQFLEHGEAALDSLNANLGRAAQLIASFKQIAVDETADVQRVINLKDYLDQIANSLAAQTRRGKLAIEIECPADIEWNTWPGALAQIVTNMIINAITHAYDNAGGDFRIRVTRQANALAIDFDDQGAGIATENLARIWEPFWTTRRGREGSGLGLSIVYNLITQRFGGQVAVTSRPNAGAHFHFVFPLVSEESRDDRSRAA